MARRRSILSFPPRCGRFVYARCAALLLAAMCLGGFPFDRVPAQAIAQNTSQPQSSVRTEFQRRARFEIPFALKAADENAAGKEVRLYASLDRGSTWQRAGTASTKASAFAVNVPRDGEYLFAIVLASASDRDAPNAQYRPSYKAIVDTEPPKVELHARLAPTGAVVAHWRITDALLDHESFQLTVGTADAMQPVALERPRGSFDPTTLVSSTSWWPARGATTISVQAKVFDRAGNPAVTTVQVNIPAAGESPDPKHFAAPATEAPPTVTADAPRGHTREASLPREDTPPTKPDHDGAPFDKFALPPPLDRNRQVVPGERQQWPTDESTNQTLSRRTEQGPVLQEQRPPLHQPSNSPAEELPSPTAVHPPVTSRVGPVDDVQPPPGERPRVLGSRRISLQYDVASVGPSGIAEVELWSTNDGGRSWESLGIDGDNRSPFTATLAGEGLYGFRLVVRNGNRVGGQRPTAGDLPEMWVVVDETKPVAAITSADVRATESGRELVIRYEAADARLSSRPIALYFADKPAGPWQTIGVGLPNAGVHAWSLDRHVVDRVYLRLEVRDEGGNVGAFETANAVVLDESEPVGRIRSVDSPRGASVQPQWPRYR